MILIYLIEKYYVAGCPTMFLCVDQNHHQDNNCCGLVVAFDDADLSIKLAMCAE